MSRVFSRLCVVPLLLAATALLAQKPSPAQPDPDIALARAYEAAGRLGEAESQLVSVLVRTPSSQEARDALVEVIRARNVRTASRQALLLRAAEWQARYGDREQALEAIHSVLDSAVDQKVLERAEAALAQTEPSWPGQLWGRVSGSWAVDVVLAFAIVLLFWFGLLAVKRILTSWYRWRRKWVVRTIVDPTRDRGGDLIMAAFSRLQRRPVAPSVSAGLLSLDKSTLGLRAVVLQNLKTPDVSLSEAAEGLDLKVGQVPVANVGKFLGALTRWLQDGRPTVTGTVTTTFGRPAKTLVRLTAYGPGHTIQSLQAEASLPQEAAEKAALKMYYLLAEPEATETDAEAMDALREGLGLLERYTKGQNGTALSEALERFRSTRLALPDLLDAYLYEGITLDLLGQHEEAASRFKEVSENPRATAVLSAKAAYNMAVAYMRTYKPEQLKKAADLFGKIGGRRPNPINDPVGVMAKAGRANSIAHYAIVWEGVVHGTLAKDETERNKWREEDWPKIQEWMTEVETIAREIDTDLQKIRSAKPAKATWWGVKAIQQLEWAKCNAEGNIHLNVAKAFLKAPLPPRLAALDADRSKYLEKALGSFKRCELLGPPGVETLANVATIQLELGNTAEARQYAEKIIALNPTYEYAYYRLAQAWEKDGNRERVIETLRRYQGKVGIPGFRALFTKYDVAIPA